MRQANTIIRERHPIPIVDKVLHDLNQSKIFSKLDIKWAFHQIELNEESRRITTFVTHKGIYRYKRLMFGISCPPEMYQRVIQQTLQVKGSGISLMISSFMDQLLKNTTED